MGPGFRSSETQTPRNERSPRRAHASRAETGRNEWAAPEPVTGNHQPPWLSRISEHRSTKPEVARHESCGRRQSSTLRGGINTVTGRQSRIEVHPISALRGASRINLFDVTPSFAKHKLFRRDRFTCAYCGLQFHERDLQREHIVPESLAARLPKGSRLG